MSRDLRVALEGLVNRWAVGGNGIDAASRDLISACSAELLRVLDEHPEEPQDAQDWERRTQAAGTAPQAEAVRYALVEQMGFRRVYGTVRETELVGKKMLEVTELGTGQVRLVGGDSLYQVTWMTRDQAESAAITGTRAVAAIDAARPIGHVNLSGADPFGAWGDGDDDESARELAAEGNATAMSDAERAEYDRDGEAWLDAQDEADDE